ncbi:uncharacterized protein BO72DRAFT_451315 [Aspergillus fijiensis CBS 313.89]|uniref:Uncharacterized protein n=1 Tax=Aspergillus fijiensis CBS 313.89 TaxID=1448319 RepID=A0A8G1VUT5_9EURO|nr:uncharacterized protein BO72DRAFT_451315 [Aspergillus fijiensis CBS 313.89]RAK73785.1 hypothetical protein BO72DRAFT_451315 [Aspergillus fijiensis CBS 313.89]
MLSGSHGWRRLFQPVTGQAGAAFLGGSGITQAAADRFSISSARGDLLAGHDPGNGIQCLTRPEFFIEVAENKEREDDEGDGDEMMIMKNRKTSNFGRKQ